MLQFESNPIKLNVIQTYAPTEDSEMESWYQEINDLLIVARPHEINFITGNFNTEVGKGKTTNNTE